MTVDQPRVFERRYFEDVYSAAYDQRNPRYKHRSYLREVRRVAPRGRHTARRGMRLRRFSAGGRELLLLHGLRRVAPRGRRWPRAPARGAGLPVRRPQLSAGGEYDVVTSFDVLVARSRPGRRAGPAARDALSRAGSWPSRSRCTTRRSDGWQRLDRDPTHVHKLSVRVARSRPTRPVSAMRWRGICATTSAERGTCTGARAASGASASAILVTGVASEAALARQWPGAPPVNGGSEAGPATRCMEVAWRHSRVRLAWPRWRRPLCRRGRRARRRVRARRRTPTAGPPGRAGCRRSPGSRRRSRCCSSHAGAKRRVLGMPPARPPGGIAHDPAGSAAAPHGDSAHGSSSPCSRRWRSC